MRDINLLPSKPRTDTYFYHFLAAIIVLGLLLAAAITVLDIRYGWSKRSDEREAASISRKIDELNRSRQPDERTQKFKEAERLVAQIRQLDPDWFKDLAYILGYLPERSSVQQLAAASDGTLTAELHFPNDLNLVASYLYWLQYNPNYSSLHVTQITRKDPEGKKEEPGSNAANAPAPTPEPTSDWSTGLPDGEQSAADGNGDGPSPLPEDMSAEAALRRQLERALADALDEQSAAAGADGSSLLGEGSPFTPEDVASVLDEIRAQAAADEASTEPTPSPAPTPQPEVLPSAPTYAPTPSPTPIVRGPRLEDEKYIVLQIELQLQPLERKGG